MIFALFKFFLDLFKEVATSAVSTDSPNRKLALCALVAELVFYTTGSVCFVVNIVQTYT